MKPRLPHLALMPRHMVAISAENITGYRLALRWDGHYTLKPAALPTGRPCIAVFDHSLPYRRKLQRIPDTQSARLALLRAAADEFPLPMEQMVYGLGLQGQDSYLYALPRTQLDALREQKLNPVMAWVSLDAGNPAACLDALESWHKLGAPADLLRNNSFLTRRGVWQTILGSGIAIAAALFAALVAMPDFFTHAIEMRIAPLRERGSTLPTLYRTTEKMAYAQQQASQFFAQPEARFPTLLAQITATIPPGHSLRSVELKNGMVKLYGNGADVKEWLQSLGFPADRISIEDGGSFKRFRAERPL